MPCLETKGSRNSRICIFPNVATFRLLIARENGSNFKPTHSLAAPFISSNVISKVPGARPDELQRQNSRKSVTARCINVS